MVLGFFFFWFGDFLFYFVLYLPNKADKVCLCVCEKGQHRSFPHPHSDAIVDSAVEVPLVEPARPKHADPSPSSSAAATSPSSFGRGQGGGIL